MQFLPYYYFVRKVCQLRKQYGRLRNLDQASNFVNDEADNGLDRTDDNPMDEIVLYEAAGN